MTRRAEVRAQIDPDSLPVHSSCNPGLMWPRDNFSLTCASVHVCMHVCACVYVCAHVHGCVGWPSLTLQRGWASGSCKASIEQVREEVPAWVRKVGLEAMSLDFC